MLVNLSIPDLIVADLSQLSLKQCHLQGSKSYNGERSQLAFGLATPARNVVSSFSVRCEFINKCTLANIFPWNLGIHVNISIV